MKANILHHILALIKYLPIDEVNTIMPLYEKYKVHDGFDFDIKLLESKENLLAAKYQMDAVRRIDFQACEFILKLYGIDFDIFEFSDTEYENQHKIFSDFRKKRAYIRKYFAKELMQETVDILETETIFELIDFYKSLINSTLPPDSNA